MYNRLITISTLFAMSACSTDFEAQDGQQGEVPTAESVSSQSEAELDNADVSSMALPRIGADSDWNVDGVLANSATATNVLPAFPVGAMNVKRVDNELQLRMFPEAVAYVKICTYGATVDCFAGKTTSVDNMAASEAMVDLEGAGQPERFTITFSDGINSYRAMGPYEIPADENIWKEVVSCEAQLNLDYADYEFHSNANGDFVRLDFASDTPASAMVCGLDESDDNICVWEELTEGRREIILPVDVRSIHPALIRDEKGCSQQFDINP